MLESFPPLISLFVEENFGNLLQDVRRNKFDDYTWEALHECTWKEAIQDFVENLYTDTLPSPAADAK